MMLSMFQGWLSHAENVHGRAFNNEFDRANGAGTHRG
jgi:hypothetical protein